MDLLTQVNWASINQCLSVCDTNVRETEPRSLTAPRMALSDKITVGASSAAQGENAVLSCEAQAHPVPVHRSVTHLLVCTGTHAYTDTRRYMNRRRILDLALYILF